MAETPRFTTGGPITSVDVASIIPSSQAATFRASREAASLLAQSTQASVARSERLSRQAQESFANIETTAIELNRKARAQDLILDASLRADEEIQSLLNTKGIEPLELAKRSEAILDKIANDTVGAAAKIGIEERDFVRQKMGNLKLQQVPNIRKVGYQRETDERLAGLQRRNFLRKAELYNPTTSQERQIELLTDITEDIKAHEGIHLSAEDTQKMLRNEEQEFLINTFYEMVSVDPNAGMKMLDDPDVRLDPRQKQNLKAQALNILQAEDNKRRQQEADAEKAKTKRAAAMFREVTLQTVNSGKDPRVAFQDPRVTVDMTAGQIQSAINFYDSKIRAASSLGNHDAFMVLNGQLRSNPVSPEDGTEAIIEIDRRLKEQGKGGFSEAEMDKLQSTNMTAWDNKQSLQNTEIGKQKTTAEQKIKRNFSFERGFITILEPSSQSQLNFAVSSAIDIFHTRVEKAIKDAEDNNLDPLEVVNTAAIADEVMIQFIPSVKDALKSQKFASGAFNQLAGDDSLNRSRAELSKDLIDRAEKGIISEKEVQIIENLWTYHDMLNKLTADAQKVTQQSMQDLQQKALAKKTGTK